MPPGQNRARGLGRPLRDVLESIADLAGDGAPVLALVDDAEPPTLGVAAALVVAADPAVVAGWTSGGEAGVVGEVGGRHDLVWSLVDDLAAVRDGARPVVARDDGRWSSFVVTCGDGAAIGIVASAGSLTAETCALLHALAAKMRRASR